MKKTFGLAIVAGTISSPAIAEGIYVGGGYTNIGLQLTTGEDVNIGIASGYTGFMANDVFGVEVELGYGVSEAEVTQSIDNIDFDSTHSINYLAGAYGRGQYAVSDSATLYGRLGYVSMEIERRADALGTIIVDQKESQGAIAFGAGLEYAMAENFSADVGISRYEFDGFNSNNIAIGLKYSF